MELTEEKYREIENNLIKLCNSVAIPRFMKALRNAVDLGLFDKFDSLKGVSPSEADFNQEFVDWISYGNLNTNFEMKNGEQPIPVTRQEELATMIFEEDIPF